MNTAVQIEAQLQRVRHKFTLDDVFRMQEAGILGSQPRVELIEGDLIEIASQNAPHMIVKQAMNRLLMKLEPAIAYHVDGTLRLSERSAPDPNLFVHPPAMRPDMVRGPNTLLVIEVSDATLRDDLGAKAMLYARHGVREYWVIDCSNGVRYVHTQPGAEGYASRREHRAADRVFAGFVPGLALSMDDLHSI